MHRDPYRPRLISYRSGDRLSDPPCSIGTKLVSLRPVEFVNGLYQTEVSFLYQIEEQHASSDILLGDTYYQSEVCLAELLLRILVALLHPLGKVDLLLRSEERHLSDLLQVHPDRVVDSDVL